MMRNRKPTGQKVRKINIRKILPKIIIICEGETEELYFNELIQLLRLTFIQVKSVVSHKGSAPISVVQSAIEKQQTEVTNKGMVNKFENIFCVIDQDSHDHQT